MIWLIFWAVGSVGVRATRILHARPKRAHRNRELTPMRKRMPAALCRVLCAALIGIAGHVVSADEVIPRYDPAAYCDEVAGFAGAS